MDLSPSQPAASQTPRGVLLFTAFEPSGDDHAASVIAKIRAMNPDVEIFAWGGAKMQAAGATLVERTGDDAVMGMPGLAKILEHTRINGRIDAWLAEHPVAAHVPVDSPGANFPIAAIAKKRGVKVVHLVAPQIWAWGRWRIHKLRKRTDLVLCLLPFEPAFFAARNVPAKFIGHMLFDRELDLPELDRRASGFPRGEPRIAMMPGSRPQELARNFPLLLDAFRLIRAKHPGSVGVVAATREAVAEQLREIAGRRGGWPSGLDVAVGQTDAVVRWCTLALVKSGTVTLQVAQQRKPMVIFYKKSNPVFYVFAKAILATRYFTLPNLVAGREIVPELVPYFGGPGALVREALALIEDPAAAERQREEVGAVVTRLSGHDAAGTAAREILRVAGCGAP